MHIQQVTGKQLVDGVVGAVQESGNEVFHWQFGFDVPGVDLAVQQSVSDLLQNERFVELSRRLDENPFVRCTRLTVTSTSAPGTVLLTYLASGDLDLGGFKIENPPGFPADRQLVLLRGLRARFQIFLASDLRLRANPTSGLDAREAALASIEANQQKLQSMLEQFAIKQAEGAAELRLEMERQLAERRASLDSEAATRRARLEEEYRVRELELNRAKEQHESKVKQFETKEPKYVRRDLLVKMLDNLAEVQKPELSLATSGKRKPVERVIWAVEALALMLLLSLITLLILGKVTLDWHVAIPLAASFTTAVTTAIYYLRWLDRLYREHAELEYMAVRYKADMHRVSWAAELATEMQEDHHSSIPSELLQALTRNLFKEPTEVASEHPVEQLLGLLKGLKEISANKDGVSVKGGDSK